MITTKFKIKVINETILELESLSEARQIADLLEERNSISNFIGNISYTYSEIEKFENG
jgi:hypothetical protein